MRSFLTLNDSDFYHRGHLIVHPDVRVIDPSSQILSKVALYFVKLLHCWRSQFSLFRHSLHSAIFASEDP